MSDFKDFGAVFNHTHEDFNVITTDDPFMRYIGLSTFTSGDFWSFLKTNQTTLKVKYEIDPAVGETTGCCTCTDPDTPGATISFDPSNAEESCIANGGTFNTTTPNEDGTCAQGSNKYIVTAAQPAASGWSSDPSVIFFKALGGGHPPPNENTGEFYDGGQTHTVKAFIGVPDMMAGCNSDIWTFKSRQYLKTPISQYYGNKHGDFANAWFLEDGPRPLEEKFPPEVLADMSEEEKEKARETEADGKPGITITTPDGVTNNIPEVIVPGDPTAKPPIDDVSRRPDIPALKVMALNHFHAAGTLSTSWNPLRTIEGTEMSEAEAFLNGIKTSKQGNMQWKSVLAFDIGNGCITERVVSFHCYLHDGRNPANAEREIVSKGSPKMAVIPRTSYGRKYANTDQRLGAAGSIREGGMENPDNLVHSELDVTFNKNTGKIEAGTRTILARLLTNLAPAQINPLPDDVDAASEADFFDYDSDYFTSNWTYGEALPLTLNNGNPNQLGPVWANKECGDNRKDKIVVVNRSGTSFIKGEVVLCHYIDGEWVIQDFGIPTSTADYGVQGWSFWTFVADAAGYFRKKNMIQKIANHDGSNPRTADFLMSPAFYEGAFRRKYWRPININTTSQSTGLLGIGLSRSAAAGEVGAEQDKAITDAGGDSKLAGDFTEADFEFSDEKIKSLESETDNPLALFLRKLAIEGMETRTGGADGDSLNFNRGIVESVVDGVKSLPELLNKIKSSRVTKTPYQKWLEYHMNKPAKAGVSEGNASLSRRTIQVTSFDFISKEGMGIGAIQKGGAKGPTPHPGPTDNDEGSCSLDAGCIVVKAGGNLNGDSKGAFAQVYENPVPPVNPANPTANTSCSDYCHQNGEIVSNHDLAADGVTVRCVDFSQWESVVDFPGVPFARVQHFNSAQDMCQQCGGTWLGANPATNTSNIEGINLIAQINPYANLEGGAMGANAPGLSTYPFFGPVFRQGFNVGKIDNLMLSGDVGVYQSYGGSSARKNFFLQHEFSAQAAGTKGIVGGSSKHIAGSWHDGDDSVWLQLPADIGTNASPYRDPDDKGFRGQPIDDMELMQYYTDVGGSYGGLGSLRAGVDAYMGKVNVGFGARKGTAYNWSKMWCFDKTAQGTDPDNSGQLDIFNDLYNLEPRSANSVTFVPLSAEFIRSYDQYFGKFAPVLLDKDKIYRSARAMHGLRGNFYLNDTGLDAYDPSTIPVQGRVGGANPGQGDEGGASSTLGGITQHPWWPDIFNPTVDENGEVTSPAPDPNTGGYATHAVNQVEAWFNSKYISPSYETDDLLSQKVFYRAVDGLMGNDVGNANSDTWDKAQIGRPWLNPAASMNPNYRWKFTQLRGGVWDWTGENPNNFDYAGFNSPKRPPRPFNMGTTFIGPVGTVGTPRTKYGFPFGKYQPHTSPDFKSPASPLWDAQYGPTCIGVTVARAKVRMKNYQLTINTENSMGQAPFVPSPVSNPEGSPTWGTQGDAIYAPNTTVCYARLFEGWPEEDTLVEPRGFAIFHFNPRHVSAWSVFAALKHGHNVGPWKDDAFGIAKKDDDGNLLRYTYKPETTVDIRIPTWGSGSSWNSDVADTVAGLEPFGQAMSPGTFICKEHAPFTRNQSDWLIDTTRRGKLLPYRYSYRALGINPGYMLIGSSGTGYAVGDKLEFVGGTGSGCVLTVTKVNSDENQGPKGAVLNYSVESTIVASLEKGTTLMDGDSELEKGAPVYGYNFGENYMPSDFLPYDWWDTVGGDFTQSGSEEGGTAGSDNETEVTGDTESKAQSSFSQGITPGEKGKQAEAGESVEEDPNSVKISRNAAGRWVLDRVGNNPIPDVFTQNKQTTAGEGCIIYAPYGYVGIKVTADSGPAEKAGLTQITPKTQDGKKGKITEGFSHTFALETPSVDDTYDVFLHYHSDANHVILTNMDEEYATGHQQFTTVNLSVS